MLRLAALVAGAVVVVAAVALQWVGGLSGPAAPSRAPGPTFNLPAALDAQIDDAGLIRSGGIWAVQGSYLMTSTDNGESWRAGVIPAPAKSVFALDADHVWAVVPAGSTTSDGPAAASTPLASARPFVVARTANGGRTWGLSVVPGSFGCDTRSFSFVDANRGFLFCSAGAAGAAGAMLLTEDGGATWVIQGQTAGLGSQFTAGDATTLWALPSLAAGAVSGPAATLPGAVLQVSRDSGRSWSGVDLPELSSLPAGSAVSVATGPVLRGTDGAFALGIAPGGSGSPAVWFYRTVDAGRSWTVVKRDRKQPLAPGVANALAGREWAVLRNDPFGGLEASGDFGSTWRAAPAYGLPANTVLSWVDFTDGSHAAGLVDTASGSESGRALMLSSSGGADWHAANFGDARAKVGPSAAQDPIAATAIARRYASAAASDPQGAWRLLSSYSQRAYGSYAAFAAAQAALYKRAGYSSQLSDPTQSVVVRNPVTLGATLWTDLNTFGLIGRAYVVVISFGTSSEPSVTVVVAPLSITGDWRVWVSMGA